jgi:phosphoribosyl 1,2-cyclic phosphate phosphodiesterase
MKVTILGSGSAGGVPTIGSGWGRCDPTNPRNRRRRPSIMVEQAGQIILVDSSPDLREQLLDTGIRHLDAVLFTHAHADHVHGIDDLREVNRAMKGPIKAYGSAATMADIKAHFGYVFEPMDPSTQNIYKPWLLPHIVDAPFTVGPVEILPFDQDHGYCRTTGYRLGRFAYSTDVLELPEESLRQLAGLDLWVVGCLLDIPHATHAHVDKALAWAERLRPHLTVITHMSPRLDYGTLSATLPQGVVPGYDGMVIEV